jgi:hypothetical protein
MQPAIRTPQLFLDVDGVAADFDLAGEKLFGMNPREAEKVFGSRRFWRMLENYPGGFFRQLPVMEGFPELFEAVKHLDPIFLTGCPLGGWAIPQKHDWRDKHFPGTRMITCPSALKYEHMTGLGDVLVDDWAKYRTAWEERGGVFILHRSTENTLDQLRRIGILK